VERRVSIQRAPRPATRCLLFLDGELYLERVQAPMVIAALQAGGQWLDVDCVYLAAIDGAARHRNFACDADFAALLVNPLLPWLEQTLGAPRTYYLAGLSLSGLATAFTVWKHPGVFAGGLCQSPSAWWNDEWLAAAIAREPAPLPRCWFSVGNQETQTDVRHPPTDMHQRTSQLDSVRRLAAAFGQPCHEYEGGHDPACWQAELPEALEWLLGANC
jgi:enterochelin esterase family protein